MEPERLGYGRVGAVYPIRIDNPNQFSLPPLVIKVAARRRSENLAREAWFYEEMEHLQGVAIARCYGLFTTEIDPKSEVLGWAKSDANYVPDDVEIPYENEDTGDIPPETLDENTMKEDSVTHPPVSKDSERTVVSVMVLERLGGMIPMGVLLDSIR
jgi:hypothetical protein